MKGLQAVAVVALAVCSACATGCAPSCENEVLNGMPSPDGRNIAFLFRRRCGAQTNTDVSVIDLHRTLKGEPGNVLAVAGEQPVKIIWRGPDQLEISGVRPPVLLRNSTVDGVQVLYRGPDRDPSP